MLVDHRGNPIKTKELTREVAAPVLTGIRTLWNETVAAGLTPYRLASLLRNSIDGDARDYLTLAEEMEERDLHYASVLGTRKLAVSRLPLMVEAASDDQKDQDLADAVRKLVRRPGMRGLLKDLLDGLGKGYSAVEIVWDRSGAQWQPGRFEWRDPRFFTFDQVRRSELRLLDDADSFEGISLPAYKFIVHQPRIKSGLAIRNGFARVAAWSYLFKNFTLKDWVAFCEVFGMPLRVGKYPANAADDHINILKTAVANLGTDAAAVMPQNMTVDFIESKNSGSTTLFKDLAEYLDAQLSKGILGQTATTQGTPGKLGGDEAQSQVRDDIRDDDAEQLAETLNRDLVRPFIDLNFGAQESYPQLQLHIAEPEDITALTTALKDLVPLGLKVEQSVIRDRIGLPDPDEKAAAEDLLGGDKDKLFEYHFKYGTVTINEVRERQGLPPVPGGDKLIEPETGGAALNRALNRQQAAPAEQQQQQVDQATDAYTDDNLQQQIEPVLAPIVKLIEQGQSFEAILEQLSTLEPLLKTEQLEDLLTRAIFAAEIYGRISSQENPDA